MRRSTNTTEAIPSLWIRIGCEQPHHRWFRERFVALPIRVQDQARDAYQLFQQDRSHPGLHFKQVHHSPAIYSVRAGISYPAHGVRAGETMVWFWIGSHADYDALLERL